jgi:hypothetical protein
MENCFASALLLAQSKNKATARPYNAVLLNMLLPPPFTSGLIVRVFIWHLTLSWHSFFHAYAPFMHLLFWAMKTFDRTFKMHADCRKTQNKLFQKVFLSI